jgi:creatinine amidohydrolase
MLRSIEGVRKVLTGLILFTLMAVATAWSQQVPRMRTRKVSSMTNQEVEDYLKRNDLVIIPVGPVEMHGLMPLEAEYVEALGWSLKMAERADAVVFPHFAFEYPGGTFSGRGTFYLSVLDTGEILKKICYSLIRQGFRRFMFVQTHGGADHILYPVIRELYDEMGIPVINTASIRNAAEAKVWEAGGKTDKTVYGLYQIVGQLDDIPLGVVGAPAPGAGSGAQLSPEAERDARLAALRSGGLAIGSGNIYTDPSQHSWSPDQPLTEQLRAQYAKEGVSQVEAVVNAMDFEPALRIMTQQIKTYKEVILPKYGDVVKIK